MTSLAVVINPIAGGGKAKKVWQRMSPGLNALFDQVESRMSNNMDDVINLTRNLIEEKPDYLLVIGGDGTLNNAINGLIRHDKLLSPDTALAFYNAGSGGDYVRQFPKQEMIEFFQHLKQRQFIESNVGKLIFADGSVRYFINIASCGLSGYIAHLTQHSRWLKKLGGTANYFFHALIGLLRYKNTQVRIHIDDHQAIESELLLMAVCNGQYFGGRMHVAPMAKVDDNLLDVVIFENFSKWSAITKLIKIYSGRHILDNNVHYIQGKKISIESMIDERISVEADGECVGNLPLVFELLPQSIQIIV